MVREMHRRVLPDMLSEANRIVACIHDAIRGPPVVTTLLRGQDARLTEGATQY